jgi:hypothetical protein
MPTASATSVWLIRKKIRRARIFCPTWVSTAVGPLRLVDAFAMLETFHPNETPGLHMALVASKWRDEVILVIHSRSFVRRRARREVADIEHRPQQFGLGRDVRSWPVTSVIVVQRFGRSRGRSGHCASTRNRSLMTHCGHRSSRRRYREWRAVCARRRQPAKLSMGGLRA